MFVDDNKYNIGCLHFYNEESRQNEIDAEFDRMERDSQ